MKLLFALFAIALPLVAQNTPKPKPKNEDLDDVTGFYRQAPAVLDRPIEIVADIGSSQPTEVSALEIHVNGKMVMHISSKGDITFGDGVSEAAKQFAEMLKKQYPSICAPKSEPQK